ncbi:MAG: helix-turn-helix transcriptional regulator [Sandaracinaceae bacterium]|nr:helix-turn-helix transcriptional regulator [Sandaracinaceae bacterium]
MVVSIEVKAIEEGLARELVHARLSTLARRAGLSAREHDVFELLVLGRSLGEIGTVLSISERTVRFHQGNLLGKLGADSRIDLLRLLL